MVQINSNEINKLVTETERSVRDGAYVVVGLGVLGFQRAQVRRRELVRRLQADSGSLATQINETADLITGQLNAVSDRFGANLGTSRSQLTGLARTLDERISPTRAQIDQQVDALEERLPAAARNVFSSVRTAVGTPEATFRSVVGLD